jgi:hypothetical protein
MPAASIPLRYLQRAALALIVLLGILLRLIQVHDSLWVDELHTAWCAGGSLAEVAQRAAIGNQSPLYFWFMWLLTRLLGASELTLRLPSLVAGSLLPLAVYWVCWRWIRMPIAGLVAAALVAIDPMSIFYATEARPYALVQVLAVVHVAIVAELFERPTMWLRAAVVVGAALLFHLHYTTALLLVAELVYWVVASALAPHEVRYRWPAAVIDASLVLLACLPALPNLLAIFDRRGNWASFVEQRPLLELFDVLPWSLSAVFVLAAVVMGLVWRRQTAQFHNDGGSRSELAAQVRDSSLSTECSVLGTQQLALCWLLVPLCLAWVLTVTDVARLFFPRYLVASAPAAFILVACCVALAPWRWARFFVGALVIAVASWNWTPHSRQEDWRGAIAWLNEQRADAPHPVLVYSGLIESDELVQPHDRLLEDYCLYPVTSLYRVNADRGELVPLPVNHPAHLAPPARELVTRHGGAWVVIRGSDRAATLVLKQVQGALKGSGHIRSQNRFGNVHVALVKSDF